MLSGRRIVLGVSGGVAAYKAAFLTRRLVEAGAEVRVVLTPDATAFIGAQTFSALTGVPAVTSLFGQSSVSPHTELGQWAELVIVAPATARTLAKLAYGLSGDAVSATVLATEAPVVVAPAMHTEMWNQPAVQESVQTLRQHGRILTGPEPGELAGGDVGLGRMSEPEHIVESAIRVLTPQDLAGTNVVVTSGGTREPIDPVRFIGNRSSGKMGAAIARDASRRGATVTLVTTVATNIDGVTQIEVETAKEMHEAVMGLAVGADVVVLAAAVADFRPAAPESRKIKKADGVPDLPLEATESIIGSVTAMSPKPFVIGFAAETGSLEGAEVKAREYGADVIVANDVAAGGSGFGSETNQVTFFAQDGASEELPLMSKREVAQAIWNRVVGAWAQV